MRYLTLRPEFNTVHQIAQGKPTQVQIGVFFGYSMPVYAADDEEMFLAHTVPDRWNGTSDIVVHLFVALSGAEDVGDNFKFQVSWEATHDGEVVPVTTHDVETQQAVLAGRNAQYDGYALTFIIDYDADGVGNEIQPHDLLALRARRVDADDPDVSNEIVVLDCHTIYQVDKTFGGNGWV